MPSSSTARFRKLRTCPRDEALLTFSEGPGATVDVAEHVEFCDFCGAEVQLFSRHAPPAALPFAPLAMPEHLHRLAQDLLAEPPDSRARFAGALVEVAGLTLTDA